MTPMFLQNRRNNVTVKQIFAAKSIVLVNIKMINQQYQYNNSVSFLKIKVPHSLFLIMHVSKHCTIVSTFDCLLLIRTQKLLDNSELHCKSESHQNTGVQLSLKQGRHLSVLLAELF